MSLVLSSSRSQFFKHLTCTSKTFFSIPHTHHLTSRPAFPFPFPSRSSGSALQGRRDQCYRRKLNPITANFSTSSIFSETSNTVSSSSPYLVVNIRCPGDVADMLSEALLCFGATATGIDDPDNIKNDDEAIVTSFFSESEDLHESISCAARSIGLREMPNYEVKVRYESDWIKETQESLKESFHPVEVTEGLWIVPEWRTPPDLEATNIIINPRLAFGDGEHPTTKLCLLMLHRLIKGGELFLDYGTGSGILAIAALKLGASLSVGLDIDPRAITAARHNACLNNIKPEMLQLRQVPINITEEESITDDEEKYDVVIANILLDPLLHLADRIVSYSKPGAVVVLSGIISEQLPLIMDRYSPFLEAIMVSKMDDWVCISGTKKKNLGDC